MIKTLILFGLLLFPTIASADCWQIRNDAAQKMCLAKTKKDENYCWQIRDNDQQKYCLALIRPDRNICWQIKNEEKKQECLALL